MPHMPGFNELLIILVFVLVLYGGKKLPELARGLGQGIKEFKKATREASSDEEETGVAASTDARASDHVGTQR
jgi:sec-independent protein translocase protein TatA